MRVMPACIRYLRVGLATLCLWSLATAALADTAHGSRQAYTLPPVITAPTGAFTAIRGLEQAQRRPDGTLVVHGIVSGSGTISSQRVVIEGTVSPGDSPGCIDFGGDVTFSFTSSLVIEIAGTTPCSEHDRISVTGTLTLNSPALTLVLLPGYTPVYGDRFDVLDWGTLVGGFGNIDAGAAALPAPLVWDTTSLHLTGELAVDVLHYADGDLAPWDSPDGQVNAADLLIASQLALGLRTPGALQYAHGDMNIDGTIDLADLLLVQQAVLP
jgi:hypothetical protein